MAERWFQDLAYLIGYPASLFLITFIAIVPGFMNAFILASLLLDRRPPREPVGRYPPVTVLIAAYNEESTIVDTLASLARQEYAAPMHVIVVNDGSRDGTSAAARLMKVRLPDLEVIDMPANAGKARALNAGLRRVRTDLLITVDADCVLLKNAVRLIVERYLSDPPGTRAVAGKVLVRNSRESWIARAQEWDYFHGIAAIKRVQSMYHGTLVAQGAFSIYDRATVEEVGGWPDGVGEDIVLTWAILARGYRVGHAEDAILFTTAPATVGQFMQQRRRWSRGMLEAFNRHPRVMLRARMSTMFIYWNTAFPLLDIAYVLGFMPGIVLALFGHYWIAGPMTLALYPIALLVNGYVHHQEVRTFRRQGLRVRRNPSGFLTYFLVYGFVMQPACIVGYLSEWVHARKTWGTK